jgi:glycylpeptide N-tetradecanoyltransferase
MDNQLFLSEQKFGPGDGFLRFYLFVRLALPLAFAVLTESVLAELACAANRRRHG